ncbi:MAG TPA: valine--tRNA ligase, partial [Proteiniclasticum sp.]|nr:valine--tRNA ligase [Proteiniclasticum sp.]
TLYILPNEGKKGTFINSKDYLIKLAYAEDVVILEKDSTDENQVSLVTSTARIYIPLLELVDREKELDRLGKERKKLESEIERVNRKLGNDKFLANANEDVVAEERAKGEKYKSMLDAVVERISALN